MNAFFVREDLASEEAFVLAPVQDLYTPPAYGPEGKGHPPGTGPYEEL